MGSDSVKVLAPHNPRLGCYPIALGPDSYDLHVPDHYHEQMLAAQKRKREAAAALDCLSCKRLVCLWFGCWRDHG